MQKPNQTKDTHMKNGALLVTEEHERLRRKDTPDTTEGDLIKSAKYALDSADATNPLLLARDLVRAAALLALAVDHIVAKTGITVTLPATEESSEPQPEAECGEKTEDESTPDDPEGDEGDQDETAEDLVDNNTKDELLELAEKEGVDVSESDTKADIAEAIIEKRQG